LGIKIKHEISLNNLRPSDKLVELSQQLIYAAKTGEVADALISTFRNLSFEDLTNKLQSDNVKKAFWINLYNAYTQIILKQNPGKYKNRFQFFMRKQIAIAGKLFSLDDIEHGILRCSKIKWRWDYSNRIFSGKTERELCIIHPDYRIHFALNCGAKSCPPIAFYNPENLDAQLDLATKAYLAAETEYDFSTKIIKLPSVMKWYGRDFGGRNQVIKLLEKVGVIPVNSNPKIKIKQYDWNLFLHNYKIDT
jgi:Protein of unknown function, DUF547